MSAKYVAEYLAILLCPINKVVGLISELSSKCYQTLISKPFITIKSIRSTYRKQLASIYPKHEIDAILKILCEDLLGWSKSDFILKDSEELLVKETFLLQDALTELLKSKPVQYITGVAHFYGHVFSVSEHTLIPRQETEELVHLIIQEHKSISPRILDIGSGSGCIAISLALDLPKSQVAAIDISNKALEIAQKNASVLKAAIDFEQVDILKATSIDFYDIVVSNPPYVRDLEKREIHKNVLEHEPHSALFVANDDALIFYRHILQLAKPHLKTIVYFEINQYLGAEMLELAHSLDFKAMLHKDLNGNDRMMKCWQD